MMMNILAWAAVAAAVLPAAAQQAAAPAAANKVLIVYFSWSPTGNTKFMAEQIQKRTGGELLRIEVAKPYPADYNATVDQARKELRVGHYFKPELKTKLPESLDGYSTIFLGSPCWWGTLASPMWTFVSKYDWKGRTIVPFMTHGGSGFGRTLADIKETCKDAKLLEGKAIYGTSVKSDRSQKEIADWLAGLGFGK
jgi:flavodoxin